MTQIVESLFGVSPERYQEQKDAALQQEALAYAQLDPYQRATAGIYAGARGLASGIGRMLGGEDPGMRRVTEQDQIIRSINLNDPETYGPAAQRAYQMGHTELAQKILLGADTAYQRQEVTRKRAADMQTRQQTAEAQAMLPSLMREAQPEQMVSTDDTGVVNTIPAQAAGINPDVQRRLMGTAPGQALLKSFGDAQKAMQGEVVKYGEGDIGVRISPITGLPERVVTAPEKYRPPVIVGPGQMAVPANDPRLTGAGGLTAPAAAAVAKSEPPSVLEYQFAKTVDGGSFIGTYQDFVKAKADAARAPAAVAAPQALPASVQEYEYAKTVPGGNFVGTYQDFVKAKADAARAPAPVVAPAALPASVAEYNFAKTLEGGGFVGTLTDFMQAKAEATRAPMPITAPQAQPASVLEYNFAKTADGGGFVGTYQDFVQSKAEAGRAPVPITAPPAKVAEYEFAKTVAGGGYKGTYTQFLNLGKSEGGGSGPGGAAGTGTILVIDPKDKTKTILVTKQRAVAENLTPAKEAEKAKPLPANLAKQEEDDFDVSRDATNLATDAYDYIGRVKNGDIKFSLKDRAAISIQSALGSQNPDVTARNDFDKFLQRLANEALRLNKGTQTDNDFKNAVKELKSSESPADVATTLQKLVDVNVRRVKDASESINRRRKNAGATEVETSIVVPSFDIHVMDSKQEKSFLANPKYPAGTNYINPQGQRMTKTKAVQ